MISHEYLVQVLSYDKETGVFLWKTDRRRGAKAGDVAGSVSVRRYRYISILGKTYLAHRLAWMYEHGKFPPDALDHINGDRDDNRISNLRAVTLEQNNHNMARPKHAASPYRGVRRQRNTWVARITIKGKDKFLGVFETPEDASKAYLRARALQMPMQPIPRELLPGS